MKKLLRALVPLFDLLWLPLLLPAILVMRLFRRLSATRMPVSRALFELLGVFPILALYREPWFRRQELTRDPAVDRHLPGIDFNLPEQLRVLNQFNCQMELAELPRERKRADSQPHFFYHNQSFESGDAEYLYSFIRRYRPAQFIEIGSGFSTLIAREAIRRNQEADPAYRCRHVCIEPFVQKWNAWLGQLPVEIIRQKVERVELPVFKALQANDVLFIDSSHMIRPQGDVLYEYLEILPSLAAGVFVHIHDIFTPRDYQALWRKEPCFTNEQYLLEALLSNQSHYRIIGALNYLAHHHRAALAEKLPVFAEEQGWREPGSFWIQKI